MKNLFIALTMVLTTQAFAAKCLIGGVVKEGMSCTYYSTRMDTGTAKECETLAKSTQETHFFHLLGKDQMLLSARYKFTDRANDIKVKNSIVFLEGEECF